MPRVSMSTSKRPLAEEEEAEALARLTTVPLKIAGVLFSLTNGGARGVAREQVLAPLEKIGCLNPNNATQKNRIDNYPTANWFLHQGKGADVRMGLSARASTPFTRLHQRRRGRPGGLGRAHARHRNRRRHHLRRAGKDADRSASRRGPPPPPLRRPSPAPALVVAQPAAADASAAVEEVEVDARGGRRATRRRTRTTRTTRTPRSGAQQRVDLLAQRFDERIQQDSSGGSASCGSSSRRRARRRPRKSRTSSSRGPRRDVRGHRDGRRNVKHQSSFQRWPPPDWRRCARSRSARPPPSEQRSARW